MAPSYRQFLQLVLSVFAQKGRQEMLIEEVVDEVQAEFTDIGMTCGPRYKEHIMAALKREARARRLRISTGADIPAIRLTPTGFTYYKELGTFPLYHRDHPRMRYLSIRKLTTLTNALDLVLVSIQRAFNNYGYHGPDIDVKSRLPIATQELFARLDDLEVKNSDLEQRLNRLEARKVRLSQLLAEVKAADASRQQG